MKFTTYLIASFLLLFNSSVYAQNNTTEKMHQVVIQLNTADTAAWSGVIGNVKNLQKVWPGKVEIEVVVHGKALNFLVADKTHLGTELDMLTKKGVVFNACENTMNKYGITKGMLLPSAKSVPSGVAELVLKQEAGWSYLRAGL
ncbi:MAG: DsrE family protein [Sediminibacterium sp.]|nr:DsrE family protein [Sediminibacterium sp.]MBP6144634.1 DsrE family protein [Sediminibacterium sp.]